LDVIEELRYAMAQVTEPFFRLWSPDERREVHWVEILYVDKPAFLSQKLLQLAMILWD
jgi:hypothetical protein